MQPWIGDFVHAYSRAGPSIRPYRNAAVSFRHCRLGDYAHRVRLVNEAGLNVFRFPAREIPGCDLLTDSGTTTMTMVQWSQMFLGDESYGSNEGYFDLKQQITETFGETWVNRDRNRENVFIFHQGRAAEHGLFRAISRLWAPRDAGRPIVPSNGHFDTTQANISDNGMEPINLFCPELRAKSRSAPFKGNMDLAALRDLLEDSTMRARVPLVYMTITNNTGGGQPVSLQNMRAVRRMTERYGIPFLFDACRFAENAWFIKEREPGMGGESITSIVHSMFDCVDGFHISLKKDGLVNIGGALVVKENGLLDERFPTLRSLLEDHQILVEGHPTYGGLAGRDLKAAVEGLRTVVHEEYLRYRISQVHRFGERIKELSGNTRIVVSPIGGHAVYLDMDEFFRGTKLKDADFPGISLTALLLIAGHRLCELGLYAFGRFGKGREIPPSPRVNN
ncbi:MAG: tryptophanase, partial [candidate division WOR-3 bacterium]